MITLLVLSLASIGIVSGSCQDNGVECLSPNTFAFCENNVAEETVYKCPVGDVCTLHEDICRPNFGDDPSSPVVPSKCGLCESSPNKLFACISETAFVFCYGKDGPFVGSEGQCKTGYVCDINNPQVCSLEGMVEPSCVTNLTGLPTIPSDNTSQCPGTQPTETTEGSTEHEPTLTTENNPEEDLSQVCADSAGSDVVQLAGCRAYVRCTDSASGGPIKETCFPQFFNKDSGSCQKEVPKYCAGEFDYLCENATTLTFIYIEDTDCLEFVACEKSGDGYAAKQTQCSLNYFNQKLQRCVDDKPEQC